MELGCPPTTGSQFHHCSQIIRLEDGDLFDSLIPKRQTKSVSRAQIMSKSRSFKNKNSRFSLIVKQRFVNTTNFKHIMTEIYKSWMKLSRFKEEKLIVFVKETNNIDEMNNFFMNNGGRKVGIFVKLTSGVSIGWKNWNDFMGPHSIHFGIAILFLNSQVRFKNWRMKSIVWMIREIFKILNQYAMDIPTLPVNQCFSHFI